MIWTRGTIARAVLKGAVRTKERSNNRSRRRARCARAVCVAEMGEGSGVSEDERGTGAAI